MRSPDSIATAKRIEIDNEGRCASEFGVLRGGGAQAERTQRINLGLALLSIVAKPATPLDRADIAAWCGCSESMIYLIEQTALKKLRKALHYTRREEFSELRDALEATPGRGC